MNANDKCEIKTYEDAVSIFENAEWSETQSALFYYRYFGEEKLVHDLKNSRDDNKEDFTELVKQIKGV